MTWSKFGGPAAAWNVARPARSLSRIFPEGSLEFLGLKDLALMAHKVEGCQGYSFLGVK